MIEFIYANLATIIVSFVLIVVVAAIILRIVLGIKNGRSPSCSCGCSNCHFKDKGCGSNNRTTNDEKVQRNSNR